ncbi:MAG: hypothetical protein ACREEW_01340, partial [Caulobacteraceae bacterium]
ETETAHVRLKDGRVLALKVVVEPPRPEATVIGRTVAAAPRPAGGLPLTLAGPDMLPADATLTFALRAGPTTRFSPATKIEVADADTSTTLGVQDGLTLEDAQVALAVLTPAKAFGPSAYGPLRYRVVEGDAAGDWHALATLVRLPVLGGLECEGGSEKRCELEGSRLFLIQSAAAGSDFSEAVQVPEGYTAETLAVPRPKDGRLYLKLHDDPGVTAWVATGKVRSGKASPRRTAKP